MGLKQNQVNLNLRVVMIFLSVGNISVRRTFPKDKNLGQNDTEYTLQTYETSKQ